MRDAFVKVKDILIAAFPFLVGGPESAAVLVIEAQVLRCGGDGRWLGGLCDCHPLRRWASFLP